MHAVTPAAPLPPPRPAAPPPAAGQRPLVAFLLGDLNGGGVQRVVMILARALAERGARIELVVCEAGGHLEAEMPAGVRLQVLDRRNLFLARLAALRADPLGFMALAKPVLAYKNVSRTLPYFLSLVDYLRGARPDVLFAATPHLNMEAVLARRLARVSTRLVLSERTHFSVVEPKKAWRQHHLPSAMRRTYMQADAITAVSNGVADDLAEATGIAREAITVVHNPTLTPDFAAKAVAPVDHTWFRPGQVPVVLGVGRLGFQKDFATLLRAFARVRRQRRVRLAIIGAPRSSAKRAERLNEFYRLAADLGVRADVDLIGYQPNPLPYMARAAVFALSSRFEGFPNVLLEALACGTPVVSTDCPSGPAEILADGAYGALVPVGDDVALAEAITAALDCPPDPARLKARAAEFDYETAIARYEEILLGRPLQGRAASAAR